MKRDGGGGTEVSVKITCKKKKKDGMTKGAYVAIVEYILTSEIKRRGRSGGMERGGKEREGKE